MEHDESAVPRDDEASAAGRDHDTQEETDRLVISFITLRRAIGVMGLSLPAGLVFFLCIIECAGIQSSISAYYHTAVRSLFVGTLIIVGAFLLAYKGYSKRPDDSGPGVVGWLRKRLTDNRAANIAGVCAIGLALFPTAPSVAPTELQRRIGGVHYTFTGIFFAMLVYMCWALFTLTHRGEEARGRKAQRNVVYKTCAGIMAASLIGILVITFSPLGESWKGYKPVFVLETVSIMTFGVAWLVKGRTLLRDEA
jgi:hypothetical protein